MTHLKLSIYKREEILEFVLGRNIKLGSDLLRIVMDGINRIVQGDKPLCAACDHEFDIEKVHDEIGGVAVIIPLTGGEEGIAGVICDKCCSLPNYILLERARKMYDPNSEEVNLQ